MIISSFQIKDGIAYTGINYRLTPILVFVTICSGNCHLIYGLNFNQNNGDESKPYEREITSFFLPQPFLGLDVTQKFNLYSTFVEYNWGTKGELFNSKASSVGYSVYLNYYRLLSENRRNGFYLGPAASFSYVRTSWSDRGFLDTNYSEGNDVVKNIWLQANAMTRIKYCYLQVGYGYRVEVDKSRTLGAANYSPEFKIAGNSKFEFRLIISFLLARKHDEEQQRGSGGP